MRALISLMSSIFLVAITVWAIKANPAKAGQVERGQAGPPQCYSDLPIPASVWLKYDCANKS